MRWSSAGLAGRSVPTRHGNPRRYMKSEVDPGLPERQLIAQWEAYSVHRGISCVSSR